MNESIQRIREANEKKAQMQAEAQRQSQQAQSDSFNQKAIFGAFQAMVDALQGDTSKAQAISHILRVLEESDNKHKASETERQVLKSGLETLEKQLEAIPTDDLKQIPKFLQQRDTVKVSNLDELKAVVTEVVNAIKSQKTTVEAPVVNVEKPVVNVPAPNVNVEAPNLKPIETGLDKVEKAVKANKPEKIKPTDLTKVEKELSTANKHLKKIVDKPVGGGSGGGGGRVSPYEDSGGIPQFVELVNGAVPTTSPIYKLLLDDTSIANVTYVGKAPIGTATNASAWQIQKIDETSGMSITWANEGQFTAKWTEILTETYT